MNFGIAIEVKAEHDKAKLLHSFQQLAEAHPFLKALLGTDVDGSFFYDVKEISQIEVICKDVPVSGVDDRRVSEDYQQLTGREWDLRREGMLKAVAYPAGKHTVFLLVVHHLLTDGRGAMMLSEELAACYVAGIGPVCN